MDKISISICIKICPNYVLCHSFIGEIGRPKTSPSTQRYQLIFELHTQGTDAYWVPPNVVKGYGRKQVSQLIYDLYMRNYRVMHIELSGNGRKNDQMRTVRISQ